MNYTIAVLDIGKTNKKVALYDDAMRAVTVRKRKIETVPIDGLDVEDVETVENWFLQQLAELAAEYPIRGISITTHGATVVCVGADGKPALPPIAYTNEVDDDVHESFWDAVGPASEIQKATATAEVKPLINLGKLLWYQKQRWPEAFASAEKILFYPQYFAYRLTGSAGADITYTGCHSYLWDYGRKDWSSVCDVLGIRDKLPDCPGAPESVLGTISAEVARATGLPADTPVGLGIHDSNSSLIPYIITQKQDFVLNSTGTWCVAMHPVENVTFEDDEIGKTVFYNLSFQSRPVKTSILMGGLEYETYTDVLMARHGRDDWPDYRPEMYRDILSNPRTFILPTVVPGTGQFPDSVARVIDGEDVFPVADIIEASETGGSRWPTAFESYEAGFALANLSLAIQTRIALQRVGLTPGTEVFIEGGFRRNPNYGALLGALLPENPVFITALEEATGFGAALCGKAMIENVPVSSLRGYVELDKHAVRPAELPDLERYVAGWLKHLEG